MRSFGYFLGTLGGGVIYDRVKGHPVLSSTLGAMAVLLCAVPLMRSIILLGVILFVLGAFEGMLDVGANTMIFWLHGDRVPPFMNGLHAFFGVGTVIAPLVVAQVLLVTQGIDWAYWILGILILPAALSLFAFKSPSAVSQDANSSSRPVLWSLLILSCLMIFLYVGSEVGFAGWIYTYTLKQTNAGTTTAAGINAAFWAGFTVSRLLSIPLAMRLKPDKILWIDLIGTAASLLLILLLPGQLWALWLGSIGTGAFMASVFPTILNDAQTRMHMSGGTTSLFFAGASLGGMVLPFLMGQIIGPFGPQAVIFTVLTAMIVALILFFFVILARKASPPPQSPVVYKIQE